MRHVRVLLVLAVIGSLAIAAAAPSVSAAGPTLLYGRMELGSGCLPPECFDDGSFHAVDKIAPRVLHVEVGTPVNYVIAGFHQVAVYGPGTKPADVEPQGFFVNDPQGRVHLDAPLTPGAFTPTTAGRYLFICNVTPHFEEAQMWAWVYVR